MKIRFAILAIVTLCFVGAFSASSVRADEKDVDAVRAASDNFYSALNAMFTGDVEPMNAVWSHGSDVTYMGPAGGMSVGWEQVGPEWKTQADLKLRGEVKAEDSHFTVLGDLAVAQTIEVGQNLSAAGKPEKVEIRATNVFRKENGQWKVIGHHTDLLPFLSK